MRIPFARIAHTRSGDEGHARNFPILVREATAGRVERHLPNPGALLLHRSPGAGSAQGNAFGAGLPGLPLDVPEHTVSQ